MGSKHNRHVQLYKRKIEWDKKHQRLNITYSLNRPTLDDDMQMRSKEPVSCKIDLISVMKFWDFLLKILNWVLLQSYHEKPQASTEDMFRYTKGKLSEKQDVNNKTSQIP